MAHEKIVVVDDDENIQELVRYNLERNGYSVSCVATGEEALDEVRSVGPDLVILDLMLPGIDGYEVCRILKGDAKTEHIAIVMLTAKGEEADVVTGLELGAEDYIVKPFNPVVLLARVRAVLRRGAHVPVGEDDVIKVGDLVIHPGRREVLVQGMRVELTSTEFGILHYLARRPGWVFTRQQIIDAARGDDYPVTDRSVDVHVVGLRKKLGTFGKRIETVRGVGYRFKEM
jgi:two-component system alkaline phosphatase synthesis response regulator PhoP